MNFFSVLEENMAMVIRTTSRHEVTASKLCDISPYSLMVDKAKVVQ